MSTPSHPELFLPTPLPRGVAPQTSRAVPTRRPRRIPWAVTLAYTAFMAVLVPVYWHQYGPANFLYFCDVALFLTLAAVWLESSLLASMAAVGILVPQVLWCADFAAHLAGFSLTGMTNYMFDAERSLFLRGLSLFHGWLPFLLVLLVARLGYHRQAWRAWTATAWTLMTVCFLWMPRPGAVLANPKAAVNINYVFGMSDTGPQTWMPEWAWFGLLMVGLPLAIYLPTHLALRRWARPVVD